MSYNNQYQSNPYQQAPSQEAGYGGYGQQQESHEMHQYGQQQGSYGQAYDQQQPYGQAYDPPQQHANVLSQNDFLSRVSNVRNEINSLKADVQQVARLHQQALTSSDGSSQGRLETLVSQTQLKTTSIRDQIRALKVDAERTTDGTHGIKERQFRSLKDDFTKEINSFLQEEQQYKARYREQIARQFRIVNPEATDAEVQQAADADWGNEGIFQTALRSNRSGQASAVLGNVRARHNELQKIEQSIAELVNLYQDMDTLIVQQDAVIVRAEEQTEVTNQNLDKGNQEVATGIKHALRTRRNKWWCLLIVVIILAIIGIALGVKLSSDAKSNK